MKNLKIQNKNAIHLIFPTQKLMARILAPPKNCFRLWIKNFCMDTYRQGILQLFPTVTNCIICLCYLEKSYISYILTYCSFRNKTSSIFLNANTRPKRCFAQRAWRERSPSRSGSFLFLWKGGFHNWTHLTLIHACFLFYLSHCMHVHLRK